MENIQAWFEPLLWILSTITALGLFARFCKPIWNFIQLPKELCKTMKSLKEDMDTHFERIDKRIDKFEIDIAELKEIDNLTKEVQQSLLRDRLLQGYHFYKERGGIPGEAYRSLCEMHEIYKARNGNSYTDSVMELVHRLYQEGAANLREGTI